MEERDVERVGEGGVEPGKDRHLSGIKGSDRPDGRAKPDRSELRLLSQLTNRCRHESFFCPVHPPSLLPNPSNNPKRYLWRSNYIIYSAISNV